MFCTREINRKINYIHERAMRLVYNDYRSSFEELLMNDKSISIHPRSIYNVAIEMFKVKNNLSSPFMKEIFEHNSNGRTTRMGDKFARPNVNKVSNGENSLRSFGTIVWNTMVSNKLKVCTTLVEFKNTIKSWIPKNFSCKSCRIY